MFRDNESQKVGELRSIIRAHEKEIDELKVDKSHREREKTLSIKEVTQKMIEEHFEKRRDLIGTKNEVERECAVARAKVELLEKQMKEAPYQQVSDLMKALMVKLPNIDIKNLSVTAKEKE
jgi:hypothetical protein